MADFSGMVNLEKTVDGVLRRLTQATLVRQQVHAVNSGRMTIADFDGWFEPLVRAELGKTLGVLRALAVKRARDAGAGSASSAVLRRMYKDELGANLNIATPHHRISSRKRIVPDPDGGKSGIRRNRTTKPRTRTIREYYGPDRGFILRILEGGRDVYRATPEGATGRGSKATYGRRGAIGSRNFFHAMRNDMEQAAQQLGQTLTGAVETWLEQNFEEYKK